MKPYPNPGLDAAGWEDCILRRIWVADMVSTQEYFDPLALRRHAAVWPDIAPLHVVWWRGLPYIENGHHRWIIAVAREVLWLPAHVHLSLEPEESVQ